MKLFIKILIVTFIYLFFSNSSLFAKFCSECGNKVDDKAKFCSECGNKVNQSVKTESVYHKAENNNHQEIINPVESVLEKLNDFFTIVIYSNRFTQISKYAEYKIEIDKILSKFKPKNTSDEIKLEILTLICNHIDFLYSLSSDFQTRESDIITKGDFYLQSTGKIAYQNTTENISYIRLNNLIKAVIYRFQYMKSIPFAFLKQDNCTRDKNYMLIVESLTPKKVQSNFIKLKKSLDRSDTFELEQGITVYIRDIGNDIIEVWNYKSIKVNKDIIMGESWLELPFVGYTTRVETKKRLR